MVLGGFLWLLMVLGNFLVVLGGAWVSWWFLVVYGGFWWFLVVLGGS